MGIVTGVTKELEVPDEPEAKVVIKRLSWIQLQASREAGLAALAKQAAMLTAGGARDAVREARAALTPEEMAKKVADAQADTMGSHDTMTLLRHGIKSWTYSEKVDPDVLDEKTATWIAKEILAFSEPSEGDVGKALSRSIAS